MDLNQTKPKRRTRSKTDKKTLRGRSVWIDETGEITGKKGTKYSEVSTTIPFGTGWITAPTIDESGNKLSDEEVKQRLKDNQGKDFITGEKLPVFSSEEKASEYAQWRSNTMFDKEAIEEGFPEETFPDLPEDKKEKSKEGETSLKGFIDYLMSPSRHFGTGQYNEGGAVMNDQMEMAFMQEGGIIDDDLDVDPVSGNEVPPGSLSEEVRDDIPAQLSEGEYVVPADVVRYYGVKFFEDLRDQAKMGLAQMEADGRIGGEPVPDGGPVNDKELSEQEMAAIREVMGMAEGGEVQNPYLQQQQLYSQPRPAPIDEKRNTTITNVNPVENQMPMQSMASGGQVQGYQDSGDVMKDAPSFVQNQFNPAQYGLGFSFMGQPQQAVTTTPQAPQGQTFAVLYHPDYATNGRSKTFYLPRDDAIYQDYLNNRGYTKQMPMTGPAGQGETPTTTDTPVTTETTGGSGGSGTNITTGGGTGKGFSFGFKNWGKDVDWTSSDAIMKFVEESQKGLIDAKTGNRLTAAGAAAGPLGAVVGATAGNLPTLQSVSDLRAAAIIARAQGLDETAASIDQQVQDILKQSSGITRFVDKFFNETVDGDAKGKAGLDRLGFEYTVDKKTGNPIFSAEQIASNKAKSSKPKLEPITSTRVAEPGVRSGVQTAKAVRGGRGTVTEKPGARQEAARKAAADKRKKRDRINRAANEAAKKAQRSVPTTAKESISQKIKRGGGFDKGGLMNKKGKKK